MSAATETTTPTQVAPADSVGERQPRNNSIRGRNRGGRGGPREGMNNNPQPGGGRGARQNWRGEGRGQQGRPDINRRMGPTLGAVNQLTRMKPPPPGLGGGGSFGDRSTEDARVPEGEGEVKGQEVGETDVEAEVCFICASPVEHNSVAPCNHRTCHICALRMRALYKTRACAHCRTEAKYVIFTDDPVKRYEDFVDDDFDRVDEGLGIKYESHNIYEDTILLLQYNCPNKECEEACLSYPDLHRHVHSAHHKAMCVLCTKNKKVFTHEHELFTQQELRKHEKFGDDNPGAVDQSGFRGHPECGFCRERFYGDDELYSHCRDRHERCHVCDRRNTGRQQQYYVDYNSLELHFRKDHFLCADQDCMDKKFVVFESEMDLKAHQLEVHPNGLSKDARKDARRVDISAFDYRTPHQDVRGGRRDGRGRGRGRDPNTEAIPQSTAQPLRRDELAYQRQMAIQSAQSIAPRTFGGQLTSTDAYAARPNRSQEPSTITAPRNSTNPSLSFAPVDNVCLDSTPRSSSNLPPTPTPQHALTPQEQARQLQHNAVMDRASVLLKHDTLKLSEFRNHVSSYRTSALTATQLIDNFFSLFDAPSPSLGVLIKELADLYENEAKRNDLLKAWNDWRAINEDYPSLPGPSGLLPSAPTTAPTTTRRILKLKSSTAQSSRSAVSRSSSWGNSPAAPVPFPPMPAHRAGPGKVGSTPWALSSTASSSRNSPAPSRPTSTAPTGASDAFPALPAAAKPNTTIFGLHRGSVKWDDRSVVAPSNPWGGAGGGGVSASANGSKEGSGAEAEGEGDEGLGKKKGNKAKKQTLYRFG